MGSKIKYPADIQNYSEGWLSDLRTVAEVVWVMPIEWLLDNVAGRFDFVEDIDFIYIDSESVSVTEPNIKALSRMSTCYQFIFSDIYAQGHL